MRRNNKVVTADVAEAFDLTVSAVGGTGSDTEFTASGTGRNKFGTFTIAGTILGDAFNGVKEYYKIREPSGTLFFHSLGNNPFTSPYLQEACPCGVDAQETPSLETVTSLASLRSLRRSIHHPRRPLQARNPNPNPNPRGQPRRMTRRVNRSGRRSEGTFEASLVRHRKAGSVLARR